MLNGYGRPLCKDNIITIFISISTTNIIKIIFTYEFIGAKITRSECSLQKHIVKHKNDKLLRSIGTRLKQLRVERGYTQEVVTDRIGVNVGLYEVGETNITVVLLTVLCNFYEIPLEEFFRGIEYEK